MYGYEQQGETWFYSRWNLLVASVSLHLFSDRMKVVEQWNRKCAYRQWCSVGWSKYSLKEVGWWEEKTKTGVMNSGDVPGKYFQVMV